MIDVSSGTTKLEAEELGSLIRGALHCSNWPASGVDVFQSGTKSVGEGHARRLEPLFDVRVRLAVSVRDPHDWPKVNRWIQSFDSFDREVGD